MILYVPLLLIWSCYSASFVCNGTAIICDRFSATSSDDYNFVVIVMDVIMHAKYKQRAFGVGKFDSLIEPLQTFVLLSQ